MTTGNHLSSNRRFKFTSEIPFYVLNDFTCLKTILNGSGGKVYKGIHDDFGQIAVKEFFWLNGIPPADYKKEVEILLTHRHPNIVPLYGIIWDGLDTTTYLGYVMEYLEGGGLHSVIYNIRKSYNTTQIYRWVEQIGRGIQFLHKNRIIHRDIKPENILVAGSQLKLADFGIARHVDISYTPGVGTLYYMAPEVIATRKYGISADIYSLAVTIWEIFHREKPYSELKQSHLDILQKVRKGARPKITSKEMERELSRFISRCWHKDASKRPAIKEIIEYFVSKLNGLNYDQQMMIPSEESSPTIISEPKSVVLNGLKYFHKANNEPSQPVMPHRQQQWQPQYTPAASPAPTQNMLEIKHVLREQQSRTASPPVEQQPPAEPIGKPPLLVTTRTRKHQQVINELSNIIAARPKENYLKRSEDSSKASLIQVNGYTPAGDIARWLEYKGFSSRVLKIIGGLDGEALFSLNRNQLIGACELDEGKRLYSQILVQKKRSNYQTGSNFQLNAILKMRKCHVDGANMAPDN